MAFSVESLITKIFHSYSPRKHSSSDSFHALPTIPVISLSNCLGSRETRKRGWEALNSHLFFFKHLRHTLHDHFPQRPFSSPRAKHTVQTLNSSRIRREQKLPRIHCIKLVQVPREANALVQTLTKTRVKLYLC